MSIIEYLIGPLPPRPPQPPLPAHTPHPSPAAWTLQREDGVSMTLQADPTDTQLMLTSHPGTLEMADALGETPWHHSLAHPAFAQLRCVLMIDPHSGQVTLADVWPRHALDRAAFEQLLQDHLRRHGIWRRDLADEDLEEREEDFDEDEDDDTEEGDGPITPLFA